MSYNPLTIDPSTIDFNSSSTGFGADYLPVDPSQEPTDCTLVPIIRGDLTLSDTNLTTPNTGCKFEFSTIVPPPPVFVPKPNIPVIPCPLGTSISGSVQVIGTGAATGSGVVEIIGGPCNYVLGGLIAIDVPPIPCPEGMTFTGSASVTTSGIASGGGSITITGGPCNYVLGGNININVPFIPSPTSSSGNDVAAACLDCTATCCTVRTNIQNQYSSLGTTPNPGDIINVCVAVYEVVANPTPTSTCDVTCPGIINTLVIDFTVGGITYYARQLSTNCRNTPFFAIVNPAMDHVTVLTGTLLADAYPGSGVTVNRLNSLLAIGSSSNVWLECATPSGNVPTSATICTSSALGPSGVAFNPNASDWSTGAVVENDGGSPPTQTYIRYPIAVISAGVSTQKCWTNLLTKASIIQGLAGYNIYPN